MYQFCNNKKDNFVIWCATLYKYQTIQHRQLADNCAQTLEFCYTSNMVWWIIIIAQGFFLAITISVTLSQWLIGHYVNFNSLSISPSFGNGGHKSHLNVNQETNDGCCWGNQFLYLLKFVLIKVRKLVPLASILQTLWTQMTLYMAGNVCFWHQMAMH